MRSRPDAVSTHARSPAPLHGDHLKTKLYKNTARQVPLNRSAHRCSTRENSMSKRALSLAIARPRCRNCSRPWTPAEGVSAEQAYCPLCSDSRRAAAVKALGLRPLSAADFDGKYLRPQPRRIV